MMAGALNLLMGGARVALSASGPSSVVGNEFQAEPAPATALVVSSAAVISASDGTGAYTYAWSHVSGDAGITTTSPSSASTTFSATVNKNASRAAVRRCTVSDGVSSVHVDVSVTLTYTASA